MERSEHRGGRGNPEDMARPDSSLQTAFRPPGPRVRSHEPARFDLRCDRACTADLWTGMADDEDHESGWFWRGVHCSACCSCFHRRDSAASAQPDRHRRSVRPDLAAGCGQGLGRVSVPRPVACVKSTYPGGGPPSARDRGLTTSIAGSHDLGSECRGRFGSVGHVRAPRAGRRKPALSDCDRDLCVQLLLGAVRRRAALIRTAGSRVSACCASSPRAYGASPGECVRRSSHPHPAARTQK